MPDITGNRSTPDKIGNSHTPDITGKSHTWQDWKQSHAWHYWKVPHLTRLETVTCLTLLEIDPHLTALKTVTHLTLLEIDPHLTKLETVTRLTILETVPHSPTLASTGIFPLITCLLHLRLSEQGLCSGCGRSRQGALAVAESSWSSDPCRTPLRGGCSDLDPPCCHDCQRGEWATWYLLPCCHDRQRGEWATWYLLCGSAWKLEWACKTWAPSVHKIQHWRLFGVPLQYITRQRLAGGTPAGLSNPPESEGRNGACWQIFVREVLCPTVCVHGCLYVCNFLYIMYAYSVCNFLYIMYAYSVCNFLYIMYAYSVCNFLYIMYA